MKFFLMIYQELLPNLSIESEQPVDISGLFLALSSLVKSTSDKQMILQMFQAMHQTLANLVSTLLIKGIE